jgi:hypothetical protein
VITLVFFEKRGFFVLNFTFFLKVSSRVRIEFVCVTSISFFC